MEPNLEDVGRDRRRFPQVSTSPPATADVGNVIVDHRESNQLQTVTTAVCAEHGKRSAGRANGGSSTAPLPRPPPPTTTHEQVPLNTQAYNRRSYRNRLWEGTIVLPGPSAPNTVSNDKSAGHHTKRTRRARTSTPRDFFVVFSLPIIVSVVWPTGPHPPLLRARRPHRGHIGGGGLDPLLRYMPNMMFLSRVGSALPPSNTNRCWESLQTTPPTPYLPGSYLFWVDDDLGVLVHVTGAELQQHVQEGQGAQHVVRQRLRRDVTSPKESKTTATETGSGFKAHKPTQRGLLVVVLLVLRVEKRSYYWQTEPVLNLTIDTSTIVARYKETCAEDKVDW